MRSKFKTIIELYLTFFKVGLFTFGGGLTMIPLLERELVDKRHWLESDELYDYFAISQTTPGIIAVNVATFCGYKRAGHLGGIFATFGVVTPSVIIISILAHLISRVNENIYVKKALMGINVAVAANISYAAVKMARKNCKNLWQILIYIASFALVFFLKVPVYIVLLSSIVIGVGIYFIQRKKAAGITSDTGITSDSNNTTKGGTK